jgi:hypothetical protein
MCKFFSAIAFKNGDITCDPCIDSHEDLIATYGLKETIRRIWVRVEFYPKSNNYQLIDDYSLHIDESDPPSWVTDELKLIWSEKLKAIISRLIITENKYCLSSGTYILSDGILIDKLLYCRILHAGYSTIKNAGYSTIENAGYSTIKNAGNSTIKNAGYSTIENAGYSTIENAGYSTIVNKQSAKITP